MINLNGINEERDVKIFNDGNAGRVKNVRLEITRKTPEEKKNSPDFKFNYFDDNGGTVNDGIYYPQSTDTEKATEIKLSRLISVMHSINTESKGKMLPEFKDYNTAMDFLVKQIGQASKNGRFNIFVAYGTKNNPNEYLRVRKFNFIEPLKVEDSLTRLVPKITTDPTRDGQWDDVMERLTPTKFEKESKPENDGTIFGEKVEGDTNKPSLEDEW